MKMSDGLFLESVRRVAREYADIAYDERIVDAACMHLVMHPEQFDVLLLPNLYGDIVSDLCAGLVGGLGVVGAANLGGEIGGVRSGARQRAGHRGEGHLANPTALLLSAVMMLRHIDEGDGGRSHHAGARRRPRAPARCARAISAARHRRSNSRTRCVRAERPDVASAQGSRCTELRAVN